MKINCQRYAPPGIPLHQERRAFLFALICASLYSFRFLIRYLTARKALYQVIGKTHVLIPGAEISTFEALSRHTMTGFVLAAFCMLCFAGYHYAYHYQGSKSIYLMRRLPKRSELHRRCLTLPVTAALLCLLAARLMLCLYYLIYLFFTPSECLPPDAWRGLLQSIL